MAPTRLFLKINNGRSARRCGERGEHYISTATLILQGDIMKKLIAAATLFAVLAAS